MSHLRTSCLRVTLRHYYCILQKKKKKKGRCQGVRGRARTFWGVTVAEPHNRPLTWVPVINLARPAPSFGCSVRSDKSGSTNAHADLLSFRAKPSWMWDIHKRFADGQIWDGHWTVSCTDWSSLIKPRPRNTLETMFFFKNSAGWVWPWAAWLYWTDIAGHRHDPPQSLRLIGSDWWMVILARWETMHVYRGRDRPLSVRHVIGCPMSD